MFFEPKICSVNKRLGGLRISQIARIYYQLLDFVSPLLNTFHVRFDLCFPRIQY